MLTNMPSIPHQEQQEAAEQIHQLISTGMRSTEAIALVAQQIREQHQNSREGQSISTDFRKLP